MSQNKPHKPVLLEAALDNLIQDVDGIYVDATFGRGGHSKAILQRLSPQGRILAFDKDPDAIITAHKMAESDKRLQVFHRSYTDMQKIVSSLNLKLKINGVLLDLGVSSPQLDDAQRGFSFMKEGPLDMRMNPKEGISAAQWLAKASMTEIRRVIHDYGEERYAKSIAEAIVHYRQRQPLLTTIQLTECIKQAVPYYEKNLHPATRTFQAIRIFINQELTELDTGLEQALEIMAVGGRLVVIAFHSLEDRIVKQFIRYHCQSDHLPKEVPITKDMDMARLRQVDSMIKPDEDEIAENVRSRSARMRVAEKVRL